MILESAASPIGLINLDRKTTGKRSAGNPHAAFDEAGAGNGRDCVPRQFSTLPEGGGAQTNAPSLPLSYLRHVCGINRCRYRFRYRKMNSFDPDSDTDSDPDKNILDTIDY